MCEGLCCVCVCVALLFMFFFGGMTHCRRKGLLFIYRDVYMSVFVLLPRIFAVDISCVVDKSFAEHMCLDDCCSLHVFSSSFIYVHQHT